MKSHKKTRRIKSCTEETIDHFIQSNYEFSQDSIIQFHQEQRGKPQTEGIIGQLITSNNKISQFSNIQVNHDQRQNQNQSIEGTINQYFQIN